MSYCWRYGSCGGGCPRQGLLDADTNVSQEVDVLGAIVRDSQAFPAPGGPDLRRAVGAYVRVVVNDEWRQRMQSPS